MKIVLVVVLGVLWDGKLPHEDLVLSSCSWDLKRVIGKLPVAFTLLGCTSAHQEETDFGIMAAQT